jgi:hypothetical protein
LISNLCCTVTNDHFGKFQDTECFLIPCLHHVTSWLPPSGETCKCAMAPIDMLLSAVSALVVRLPSLEVLEGLTNYPVYVAWTLTGRVLNIHVQSGTLSSHVYVFTIQMKTLEYVQTIHLPRIKSKLQNSNSSAYKKQVQDNCCSTILVLLAICFHVVFILYKVVPHPPLPSFVNVSLVSCNVCEWRQSPVNVRFGWKRFTSYPILPRWSNVISKVNNNNIQNGVTHHN